MNDPRSTTRATRLLAGDAAGIAEAAAILKAGGLVALPTETVYGLAADATRGEAVAGIYAAKERPRFNPLISHVPDMAAARMLGRFDDVSERLAQAFWPGPMTLVVPRAPGCPVSDLALAGHDSIAIRMPAHPAAQALLRACGLPLAAPSANRSGRVSPTSAVHVMGDLEGRIDAVLDAGTSTVGIESTILSCLDGTCRILRPGGLAREEIERILGRPVDEAVAATADAPLAPGMLASHYAPRALVRLDAMRIAPGEAVLTFGAQMPAGLDDALASINLSPAGDLAQAAARLFAALRELDATGAATIAVVPIPRRGLGEAIDDRLRRAAAERA